MIRSWAEGVGGRVVRDEDGLQNSCWETQGLELMESRKLLGSEIF